MSVKINLSQEYAKYLEETAKTNIINLADTAEINEEKAFEIVSFFKDELSDYIQSNENILTEFTNKFNYDEENEFIEELIEEYTEEENKYFLNFIISKWNDFIKYKGIKEIENKVKYFLSAFEEKYYYDNYNFFFEEYEYHEIFKRDFPLFYDENVFIKVSALEFEEENYSLNIDNIIKYIIDKNPEYKQVFNFILKKSGLTISPIFFDMFINIKTYFDSYYYDEYFYIDAKLCFPSHYYGEEDEKIEDNYEAAENIVGGIKEYVSEEELQEKFGEEFDFSQLTNIVEDIIEKIQNFAEKIENFYEDIFNDNYYNNPKYKKENDIDDFFNLLNKNISELVQKNGYGKKDFIINLLEYEQYSDMKLFRNYKSTNLALYFIQKYKDVLKIDKRFFNMLFKAFYDKEAVSFFAYDRGYDIIDIGGTKEFIIKNPTNFIYALPYFKEDEENLYKPVKEKNKEYEKIFEIMIKSIEEESPEIFIKELFKYDKPNDVIKYVNSRLFEKYFNDNKFRTYFNEQIYYKFIYFTYKTAPLFPMEFPIFLIAQKENDDLRKNYKDFYTVSQDEEKKIDKNILLAYLNYKDINKEKLNKYLNKLIMKNSEFLNNKKNLEYYATLKLIIKNKNIKPLSLCKNPLKEKAYNYIILKSIEKQIEKTLEEKNRKKEKELNSGSVSR